jgi:hypothetical protein
MCLLMKTNITLKVDSDLLQKVRVMAAEENTSISALLSSKLEEIVRNRSAYARAKKRALARLKEGFELGWKKPSSRDELHER